ncbi:MULTISPECIES: dTDP-4-dehydrorhamnose 3,5-epimerase [unclassified Microcoleus]|uniref:dTDP-4-dehydrorhamnose 3,5-epimerase n=1 Tax=unclassified Microcoleus TaxID=2642155 RepID=UPI002FCF80B1
MGILNKVECIRLEQDKEDVVKFFTPLVSNETVLFEIPPQTADEALFCHHFQTDQLVVVRGSMVLVFLQNRYYDYILSDQHQLLLIKIPPGIPHALINFSSEPCLVLNAIIRHGTPHPKDYQPIKKPFPFDFERVKKLQENPVGK